MVIVDTTAAYFQADEKNSEENSNSEMGRFARVLRRLTTLPGKPTVIANSHPTKNATEDNLLPRGGGAFIAEVDGNLVCRKRDSAIELGWQGKFRGPDFAPIGFQLFPTTCDAMAGSFGPVLARPLSEEQHAELKRGKRDDDDALLTRFLLAPSSSFAQIAKDLDWMNGRGEPDKSRVQRGIRRLESYRLLKKHRDEYQLTDNGKTAAKKASK